MVSNELVRLHVAGMSGLFMLLSALVEKEIAVLRRENRKSMLVSVFIFVLLGLAYWIYSTYK